MTLLNTLYNVSYSSVAHPHKHKVPIHNNIFTQYYIAITAYYYYIHSWWLRCIRWVVYDHRTGYAEPIGVVVPTAKSLSRCPAVSCGRRTAIIILLLLYTLIRTTGRTVHIHTKVHTFKQRYIHTYKWRGMRGWGGTGHWSTRGTSYAICHYIIYYIRYTVICIRIGICIIYKGWFIYLGQCIGKCIKIIKFFNLRYFLFFTFFAKRFLIFVIKIV